MKSKKLSVKAGIGIFFSSSPVSATATIRYLRGKDYLERKGFQIFDGNLFQKSDFYRSGTIQERANEFNQLLYNDSVDILMSSIGGNNTNSILLYIDYEYLKKYPKIIIGYSDTTALLLAIYAKTGLVTFYDPALAPSFGELAPFVDITYKNFEQIICGKNIEFPFEYEQPNFWTDEFIDWNSQNRTKKKKENVWICVNSGTCEGRLIGGNLNTMEGFWGTSYMPTIQKGDILLLEDSFKDASTIERSFSLLKLSGVFDKVGGIILGKHENFNDSGTKIKPYEILLEVLDKTSFPILADFDCCHTHPMLTVPIGCKVRLDATNKKVSLLESFLN